MIKSLDEAYSDLVKAAGRTKGHTRRTKSGKMSYVKEHSLRQRSTGGYSHGDWLMMAGREAVLRSRGNVTSVENAIRRKAKSRGVKIDEAKIKSMAKKAMKTAGGY